MPRDFRDQFDDMTTIVRFLRRPVGPRPVTLLSGLQLQNVSALLAGNFYCPGIARAFSDGFILASSL